MIGKLKGKIDSIFEDHVIIDVGGVGYLVFLSAKNLHNLAEGDDASLLIVSHIREDHIHLYGFINNEDKQMFTILQSVSGIGPRMALNILSYLSPGNILSAVSAQDKEMFKSISGVGVKLAERIIIELKGKSITTNNSQSAQGHNPNQEISVTSDAIAALVNLGISRVDAQNRVFALLALNPEASLDELIRSALKSR